MAPMQNSNSLQAEGEGWQHLSLHSYPLCLLQVQVDILHMGVQETLGHSLPQKGSSSPNGKKKPPIDLPPVFQAPSPSEMKGLSQDKQLALRMESEFFRYQAKILHLQAQRQAEVVPCVRTERTIQWRRLKRPEEATPAQETNPLPHDGQFTLLIRPLQAIQLLSSSTASGLVLFAGLTLRSAGPQGPWWEANPWRLVPMQNPFIRPLIFVPLQATPNFPLKEVGQKAQLLNKNVQQNGLWTVMETPLRPYDPVTDGM